VGADGKPLENVSQDIIISKALGELFFPGENPLGKRTEDHDGDQYRIVGVIDRFYNPYGWPIHEYVMFFPSHSRSFEGGAPYLVRTEPGKKAVALASIEKALLSANGGRNVEVKPVTDIKQRFQARTALLATILTVVIALLLFITALGIVGLTVFSVAERTRQIGTRRALGAQRQDILRYFLLENWIVTTLGLALGILLAFGLNVALVARVNSPKMEPGLVAGGMLLLWLAGLAATFLPALRGARVAPAVATRNV
jgi:putative ABC transport system permease protein